MSERVSLGVDVSKDSLDVCLLQGQESRYYQVANHDEGFADLQRWLRKCGVKKVRACLEATGLYGEQLAEFMHKQGHEVAVVNPLRIKAYSASQLTRNKTDRVDSKLIADFCRTQEVGLWSPPPAEWRELRELVRHRSALVRIRQQERNRLCAGLHSDQVMAMLREHLLFIQKQIGELEKKIQEHIAQHPVQKHRASLLCSIPGISHVTAAVLLAEMRDLLAFDDVRELVAYAGLNPRQQRSGSSVFSPSRISKTGNARIRAALYWPAISALRSNPLIKPLCDRIVREGRPKMVAIVAAMRKLLHLAYGVLKHDRPFNPSHPSTLPALT